jgi:site-specific recombinase XerC
MTTTALPPEEIVRQYRQLMQDKSYQATPLGEDVAEYLRAKRKRLTPSSYRDYESCLHKLVLALGDLRVEDLEPPVGTGRVEKFMDRQWGDASARTYNKNLSIVTDFFKHWIDRRRIYGNPAAPIERAKARGVYRTTFTTDQRRAIIAEQEDLRDRIALRLLLDYGLRKGALQATQFKHFDHFRKRLTIFTKGEKVRELPIPDPGFWFDLERHIQDIGARPHHYLMPRQKRIPRAGLRRFPDEPMGVHGLHSWWYRCLENAGIVPSGTTRGEHMHKARHTAGQRVLDATGNLKAVQKLLGHSSIQTTADSYTDWDIDQLAATMADVLSEEDE